MSRRPARLISLFSCMALAGAFAGSACSDTFDCGDAFQCEDGEMNGGAGGERMSSDDDAGGAGGEGVLVCAEDTFDCNEDPKDGCEVKAKALTVPSRPESRRPLRSAYTGSLHARKTAATLRPTFVWSESEMEDGCGQLHYEIEVDDSCKPGELNECEFDSPEVKAESEEATYTPAKDLPVSEEAPVGAFYTWRVRACDEANCSEWSDPAPVNVGRTLQDLNGDGYADAMVSSDKGIEVFFGGAVPPIESAARAPGTSRTRFVGDLNGDGFADFAFVKPAFDECGYPGDAIHLIFGNEQSEFSMIQSLCRTGGSPSVEVLPRDVGDLKGDGFDDLAVTRDYGSTENSILIFAGGEKISEPLIELETIHRPYILSSEEQILAGRGDYNEDGFADFLAGGYATASEPNLIFAMPGAPILSRQFDLVHQIEECSRLRWIESVGDVSGDQVDDWILVCVGSESSVLGVIHGGGEELDAFSESFNTDLSLSFVSPALDFDGDGVSELVVGVSGESPLIWSLGEPINDQTLRFERFFAGDRLDAADYNGNARLDIVIGEGPSARRVAATTSFNVVPVNLQLPADAEDFVSLAF